MLTDTYYYYHIYGYRFLKRCFLIKYLLFNMTNVRTLRDINKGHRLGSMYEEELENKLYTALKPKTEVNDLSEKLQYKYSK